MLVRYSVLQPGSIAKVMLGMSDRLFIGKLSVVTYVKDLIDTGLDVMAQEFVEHLGSWGQMIFLQ